MKRQIKNLLITIRIFKLVIFLKQRCTLLVLDILAFFIFLFFSFLKISEKKIILYGLCSNRIGAIGYNMEILLRRIKNDINLRKRNIHVVACMYVPAANRQLLNMYRREIRVIENRLLGEILLHSGIKNAGFYHSLKYTINVDYEFNCLKPALSFTEKEKDLGRKKLKEMGISEKDWFVCFHSRASNYETHYHGLDISQRNDFRDSKIENYLLAAEYIVSQGGYAIRMGAVIDRPLHKKRNPRIIDYSVDYRSDFMDIYLAGNCKFFLGNTAGIYIVSTIFGVPVAWANSIPYNVAPLTTKDAFIPKKIWDIKKNRFLTFEEIFNSDIVNYCLTEQYRNAGLDVIENSADEILELAKEVNMRLDNEYISDSESERLQVKFNLLLKPRIRFGFPGRIGAYFLNKNKDLFENYNHL